MKTQLHNLSLGDSFLFEGVRYELAEDWTGEVPDTLECVNTEALKYVEFNAYSEVGVFQCSPYDQGQEAYRKLMEPSDNPFTVGEGGDEFMFDNHTMWQKGWDDQMLEEINKWEPAE